MEGVDRGKHESLGRLPNQRKRIIKKEPEWLEIIDE